MKKILLFLVIFTMLLSTASVFAQEDKFARPSPPAVASETITNGNKITINYSQPALKGRTIGKDIVPYDLVWRTGANEATTFEITKDAQIQKKFALKAGKYSLYTIPGEKNWTIIFNKKWNQWGTVYNESEDALRVIVPAAKSSTFTERMTFTIAKDGLINLVWGDTKVAFSVN